MRRAAGYGAIALSALGIALIAAALMLAHSRRLVGLIIAFLITASVTTFDKRVTQAKMRGESFPKVGPFPEIGPDTLSPPRWVALLYWPEIGLKVALIVLNWKCGLLVYVAGFVLATTGLLETVGRIFTAPFKPRGGRARGDG